MSLPTDLITPKAAARLLHAHVASVYRWITQGKLRSWKRAGTRHLVNRADVLALLVQEEPAVRLESSGEGAKRYEEAVQRLKESGLRF